jgi:hypothetical protein
MLKYTSLISFAFLLSTMTGCGGSDKETAPENKTNPATLAQLQSVFSPVASEDAISVLEARKTAQPGQSLKVVGRVGGIKHPFSENFASLVLTDDSTETCEKNPDDGCKTPWDACCVPTKILAASRMTIQVSDAQGMPLEHPLKDVQGLKELDRLVIQGEIASTSNKDNLILNATSISIQSSQD